VCRHAGWSLTDLAAACVDGGAHLLQLRAKDASSGWLLEAALEVVERTRGAEVMVIVNDRADVAHAAGARGVHVGQDDLPPAAIRRFTPPGFLIGLSTHTPEQLTSALATDADYVAIGPVFATRTKETGHEPLGLEPVRAAAAQAHAAGRPLVAIGGITLDRAADVIAAGASSVAVLSDLLQSGDPAARVRQYERLGLI
jgi:thiamine-phosphate pyrophosphorylase